MNQKYDFIEGKITPTFFYHSIPVIFSMLFAASISIIDGIFISNFVGAEGLAVVNIVCPILNVMWGMNIMLVVGSTVSIGKQLGARKYEMANYIFSKTLIAVLIANLLFSVVAIAYQNEILAFMGATPEIIDMAHDYYFYVVIFTIFYGFNLAIGYFIRLEGRTSFVAMGLVIFVLANIFLDYLYIVVFDMGLKGAAYATSFAELFSTLFLLTHYFHHKYILRFSFNLKRWRRLIRSCYNGISELITESSVGVVLMLFNVALIDYIGIDGVIAFTIINYFLLVQYTTVTAVGDSLQPIISINYGRRKWDRILAFITHAFKFSFSIGAVTSIILYFFAESISSFFVDPNRTEVYDIIREFAKVFWITFLLNGMTVNASTYFTATLRPKFAATISCTAGIIFPILSIKILPVFFGVQGIYWAMPFSQLISFLLAMALFVYDALDIVKNRLNLPEPEYSPEQAPLPVSTPIPEPALSEEETEILEVQGG